MLHLPQHLVDQMAAHAYRGLPDEACGLLVGHAEPSNTETASNVASPTGTGTVVRFEPTRNAAASSRIYTIDGLEQMKIERQAESEGLAIIGVMHSHTHTTAYPSPTDVAQAEWLDPAWHFVIVSLRDAAPSTRSYRIVDGEIFEETIVVVSQ